MNVNGLVKIFRNENFGEIRTIMVDGKPYFVGKDVAEKLGYKNTVYAIKKYIDNEDKQNCQNNSFGSNRGLIIINESGVYSLIYGSKLPQAKAFKSWVTSIILPELRQNGVVTITRREQLTLKMLAQTATFEEEREYNEILIQEGRSKAINTHSVERKYQNPDDYLKKLNEVEELPF